MKVHTLFLSAVITAMCFGQYASADLYHYFPLDEGAGASTANLGTEGTAGTVNDLAGGLGIGGNAWVLGDPTRGTVLSGNDSGSSAHTTTAGVPHTLYNASWTQTVWASVTGSGNDVILGHRHGSSGGFTKLDTNNFEWSFGGNTGPGTGTDGMWHQYTLVKDGTSFESYRDGVLNGTGTLSGAFTAQILPWNIFGDGGERPGGLVDEAGFFTEAFSAGKAAALYNTSDTSQQLAYGLDEIDGIFGVFDDGGTFETGDGLSWSQASGLGGALGAIVEDNGTFGIALDGNRNGVLGASAAVVPEPASIAIWSLLSGLVFFGYHRGRKQK